MENLKYSDDNDRSYGAAGMAIGLVVYDGEDMLASITLDGDPNDMVSMSPDFYFAGNPGVSAKTAWKRKQSGGKRRKRVTREKVEEKDRSTILRRRR